MKKIFVFIFISLFVFSCKEDDNDSVEVQDTEEIVVVDGFIEVEHFEKGKVNLRANFENADNYLWEISNDFSGSYYDNRRDFVSVYLPNGIYKVKCTGSIGEMSVPLSNNYQDSTYFVVENSSIPDFEILQNGNGKVKIQLNANFMYESQGQVSVGGNKTILEISEGSMNHMNYFEYDFESDRVGNDLSIIFLSSCSSLFTSKNYDSDTTIILQ